MADELLVVAQVDSRETPAKTNGGEGRATKAKSETPNVFNAL